MLVIVSLRFTLDHVDFSQGRLLDDDVQVDDFHLIFKVLGSLFELLIGQIFEPFAFPVNLRLLCWFHLGGTHILHYVHNYCIKYDILNYIN